MKNRTPIYTLVAAVAILAILAVGQSWRVHLPFPGVWALFVFGVVTFLLDLSNTKLRGGDGEGSVSFVLHLAAGVLFGAFWAAVVALWSTGTRQLLGKRPIPKVVFNVAQRTLSVVVAIGVYRLLGGSIPPEYLVFGRNPVLESILKDLGAFFAASCAYIMVNSMLVSMVVAYSTQRSLSRVWTTNTLWVLGYDLAASTLALFVAWMYLAFDRQEGILRLGFVIVFLPAIAIRHVYGNLNKLRGLYDELDSAHERLERNLREQLEMMVKSIEARDPYTSGHSRRVALLSKTIALDLGLEPEEVEQIENAALLHDVGKIHAEFAPLLQKEGRLTQDEWELMKTHAAKSAELVGLFSRFHGVVQDAVRWHHERWDGKGYPDGVREKEIPLGARIIMVSDTIDAMTTDRPYRKALPFETVIEELHKYRGQQFDPDLVGVVVNSVSIRRLVSEPELMAHYDVGGALPKATATVPLRSQKSFWEALVGSGQRRA